MKNWLKDKTVIVTGASSGIGKEVCRLLIEKYEVKVIGVGRSEEKMLTFQAELKDKAENFSYRLFDVASMDAWNAFAEELCENKTAVTLLIHNAGIFPVFQTVEDTSIETLDSVMQTNFYSAVYGNQALSASVLRGEKGGIVHICSSGALCTVVGTMAYSASKSALKAYVEALMLEQKGKYVAVMYPGTTKTELFRGDKQTENSALDKVAMPAEKMAKKIVKKIYRRKRRAVLGWDAKAMNFLAKIAPVKGPALICRVMRKSGSKVFKNVFKDKDGK